MAVDFATQLYQPCFDLFSRPVTFYPFISQPSAAAFGGRGIYDSNDFAFDVYGDQVFADARIELDILALEFPVMLMQKDQLYIPEWLSIPGGNFEVSDVSPNNAGGEVTLSLRRIITAANFPVPLYPMNVTPAYVLGKPSFDKPPLSVI